MSEHTFRLPANYRTREAISLPIGIVVLLAIGFALARFFPHLIPVPWLVGIGLTLVAMELISIATTGLRLKWTTISVSTTGVELLQGRIWRRRQFIPALSISSVSARTGPLDRRFGHMRLSVVSASKEISLPVLSEADGRMVLSLLEEYSNG